VVTKIKSQLKDLMVKYENNKSLADFKVITDTDFGNIVDLKANETSVQDLLTEKQN